MSKYEVYGFARCYLTLAREVTTTAIKAIIIGCLG